MLLSPHDHPEIFHYHAETSEEAKIPKVFGLSADQKRLLSENPQVIVDANEFQRNFDLFTEGNKYLSF
jgi:hypothetical protein